MSRLEIHADGRRKVYQILEDELSIGSHASNQIRLRGDGIAGCHARIVRDGDGLRLEDLDTPGGTRVNGAAVAAAVLRHGDRIELGAVTLVYGEGTQPLPERAAGAPEPAAAAEPGGRTGGLVIGPIPGVVPRPPAPRGAREPSAARRLRSRRSSSGLPWWAFTSILAVIAVTVLFIVRCSQTLDLRDPRALLDLAETQRQRGDLQAAMGTLDAAAPLATDAELRRRIRLAREDLRTMLDRQADTALIEQARVARGEIDRFVRMHLDGELARPACRELARLIAAWLAEYGDVCGRYEDQRAQVDELGALRARIAPVAAMGEPDTADDVLFSANRRTRFRRPRYAEALELLDLWLLRNPLAPGSDTVRAERQRVVERGRTWAAEQCDVARRALQSGDPRQAGYAAGLLRSMRETGVPADWAPDLEVLLAGLEALERDGGGG